MAVIDIEFLTIPVSGLRFLIDLDILRPFLEYGLMNLNPDDDDDCGFESLLKSNVDFSCSFPSKIDNKVLAVSLLNSRVLSTKVALTLLFVVSLLLLLLVVVVVVVALVLLSSLLFSLCKFLSFLYFFVVEGGLSLVE